MKLRETLKTKWSDILLRPNWQKYLFVLLLLLIGIYFAWLKLGKKEVTPGSTIQALTVPSIAQMEQKTITPSKLVVIKDKQKAIEKLKLSVEQQPTKSEEIIRAVLVPKLKYGGTAAVFVNTTTGKSRTVITANKSPWFSFEKTNYLGLNLGVSTNDGVIGKCYYKRDIAQIKGIYLQPQIEVIARPDSKDRSLEGIGSINIEGRW